MPILAMAKQSGVVFAFIQNKLADFCASMRAQKYVEHQVHKFGSFSSVTNLVGHLPKELEIISIANDRDYLLFVRGKQGDKQ